MKISLIPSVDYIEEECIKDKVVVVIDVLRATSVITTAIGNGALEVVPVVEIEEAIKMKGNNSLLGGERKGLKIEGFDLSNSPLEYSKEKVYGKRIIMTTTNGTRAINKSLMADKIYIGSMLNGKEVAKAVVNDKKDVAIICAGTYGKFSLDDFICAGKIIYEALNLDKFELEDFAATAFAAYRDNKHDVISYVSMASHYKYLLSIGLEEDVKYCFKEDLINVVPQYKDGAIKVQG
jgi:2-phosphosulfolactate phosphatase